VNGVAQLADESQAQVMEISNLFAEINDEMAENADDTSALKDARSLCEMAKVDHIIFTKRVIDAVMDRIKLKSNELSSHELCRLGQWYGSLADRDIKAMPEFTQLLDPHRKVHSCAQQALAAHETADQDAALKHLEEMTRASHIVISHLDALSKSIEHLETARDAA
jgi:methyl-accepting chemotaxis protein